MTLYHYTCPRRLPYILTQDHLRLTESNVSLKRTGAGPRVVWLTDAPQASGSHGLNLSKNRPGTDLDKTRVRFTVDAPDAVRWLDSSLYAAMTQRARDMLIETGGGMEAARTWWVSFEPIPRDRWLAIELDGEPVQTPIR